MRHILRGKLLDAWCCNMQGPRNVVASRVSNTSRVSSCLVETCLHATSKCKDELSAANVEARAHQADREAHEVAQLVEVQGSIRQGA